MFDWNDLVFFLELASQGRLMPAARRLKVDHTTVSRRISELEKDLAVRLFERKPDDFVLTEDGYRLLSVAKKMEVLGLYVIETIKAVPSKPTGKVRELYVSIHEDIQFRGRVRALTRFLCELFEHDAAYLNAL
jgi:hypothetical protein